MKTRERGVVFDYSGIAALGDVWYGEEFDKWDDIVKLIKEIEEVPIVKSHRNGERIVGKSVYHELDKKNKRVYIGFNKEDINVELDMFNAVSPQWITDDDGKIIGINHWAIGNSFNPLCPESVCNITKNRGDEAEMPDKTKEKKQPDVDKDKKKPDVEKDDSSSEVETLKKEMESLKKELEDLKKPEGDDEESSDDKDKKKLRVKTEHQHTIPERKNRPLISTAIYNPSEYQE